MSKSYQIIPEEPLEPSVILEAVRALGARQDGDEMVLTATRVAVDEIDEDLRDLGMDEWPHDVLVEVMVWVVGDAAVANKEVRSVFDIICEMTPRDVLLTWEHGGVVGQRRDGQIDMDPVLA